MKTIKLKLTTLDETNPVLVDHENNVIVSSDKMAWIVPKSGQMTHAQPAILAMYMNKIVDVRTDDFEVPTILRGKAIILL